MGTLTLAGGIVALLGTGGPPTGTPSGTAAATDDGPRARAAGPAAARDGDTGRPRPAGSARTAGEGTEATPDGDSTGGSGSGSDGGPGAGEGGTGAGAAADGRAGTGAAGATAASQDTDHQAVEYFRTRWGSGDAAAKHVKDIRTVGGYLRIYTDLPESADDSAAALALCERGLAYLGARGTAEPVVFVQARPGENGSPVLANILGHGDTTCRVTHPDPG
ncbi:hypothetical protein ACGF0J_03570 [Nonomuraea sp. NPDC047897]|uniref:hypothetical protein n=1 Tax=Nonomuraea sp. NPDC047897 TaxID=3364346 RepID=UPI003719BF47